MHVGHSYKAYLQIGNIETQKRRQQLGNPKTRIIVLILFLTLEFYF